MRRDAVRLARPGWNRLLRREDQKQLYMELTPLLFYLGAMVLRQVKCNSPCSIETVTVVQKFLNELPEVNLHDSRLYTPTLSNYKRLQGVVFSLQQNCSRSTLMCFEKEMTVLVQETQQKKRNLSRRLKSLTQQLEDKMDACPQCEVYKEEEAKDFLSTLLYILQFMCSDNNTTTKS